MDEDPHAVLGVPTGVSRVVLKRAFRARALATHPDHGGDRVQFEAAVAAYRTLLVAAPDDACAAQTRRWTPYLRLECAAPSLSVYDSRRRVIRPVPAAQRDDFDEVLARFLAAQAA